MRAAQLAIEIDPRDRRPAFVQIAAAIAGEIGRGRLRPGARLPSSRALARELGVHRNTVLGAYRELEGQGWIAGAPGRGTFVSSELPEEPVQPLGAAPRPAERRMGLRLPRERTGRFQLPGSPPGVISLARNVPDPRLFPAAELARSYRRALRRGGGALLDYGDERGHPHLRGQLAAMLRERRGLTALADDVLVTHGSQMALYLAARALVPPGGVVAVESLGYSLAWEAFLAAGARLVAVPVDARGLRVDRLEALARRERLCAVYLTPHHQYPTTVVLSAERRLQLLELARRRRIAVVEDDYDHEVHYQSRPVLPLASADTAGVVVYVGSLSKVFAPGVRTGYVVAPRPVLERMARLRRALDRQGDPALEHALADLLEDGVLPRHARRMRRVYRARRDAFVAALREQLAGVLDFDVPAGGLALWARVCRGVDVEAWSVRAARAGVAFPPARVFAFDGRPRAATRLAYARHDEATLREAVGRMRAALGGSLAPSAQNGWRPADE